MNVFLTQLRARCEDACENFRGVDKLIARSGNGPTDQDILVLPELIDGDLERNKYERLTSDLARAVGCHVVGGTNHHTQRGKTINSGARRRSAGSHLSRVRC